MTASSWELVEQTQTKRPELSTHHTTSGSKISHTNRQFRIALSGETEEGRLQKYEVQRSVYCSPTLHQLLMPTSIQRRNRFACDWYKVSELLWSQSVTVFRFKATRMSASEGGHVVRKWRKIRGKELHNWNCWPILLRLSNPAKGERSTKFVRLG